MDDLPYEKQFRLEKIRHSLKDLPREDLEEMLMQTTKALVKLTHKVNEFCKANGIL